VVITAAGVKSKVSEASEMIVTCLSRGDRVYTFGCGGQMANAMHFAAELSGKYEQYEDSYPCICLGTNVVELTAITNDFGWDTVFERLIRAQARPGDIVVGFSVSGHADYYGAAVDAALGQRAGFISIVGADGRGFGGQKVLTIKGQWSSTPEHQEEQLRIIHEICHEVKKELSLREV